MGAKSLLVTYHGASIRSSIGVPARRQDGRLRQRGGRCSVWNAWVTNDSGSLITPQMRKVS